MRRFWLLMLVCLLSVPVLAQNRNNVPRLITSQEFRTPSVAACSSLTRQRLGDLCFQTAIDIDGDGGSEGQLMWYDGSSWLRLGRTYTGTSVPVSCSEGDLFILNNASSAVLYSCNTGDTYSTVSTVIAGSDTQVQYNDGGVFGGEDGLTYNETTNVLTAQGGVIAGAGDATDTCFTFDQATGTDPRLCWDDGSSRWEFDTDGTVDGAETFLDGTDMTIAGSVTVAVTADLSSANTKGSTSVSEGTCTSAEVGYEKFVQPTATTEWPYKAACLDAEGDGIYFWRRINEEGAHGYIPPGEESIVSWTAQTAALNDAACVEADVPYPCCTGSGTGACTESATPIGVLDDGVLYGAGGGGGGSACTVILQSSTGGDSWTVLDDLTTDLSAVCLTGIKDVGDGEVVAWTQKEIVKSTGWPTPTAWAIVLNPSSDTDNSVCVAENDPLDCCAAGVGNGTCDVHPATFLRWAVDTYASLMVVSEYIAGADPTHWDNSRRVYLSQDDGDNFSTILDLGTEAVPGGGLPESGEKTHIHGVAIDPWAVVGGSPRLWVSYHRDPLVGAAAPQLTYSDDLGSTWVKIDTDQSTQAVDGLQPTTIVAGKYGMVLGNDYDPEGMGRVLRRTDATKMQPEQIIEFEWEFVANGFTRRGWRDPRNGVVYTAWDGLSDGPSFVGVSDGFSGNVVRYVMPDNTGSDSVSYWGAFVTWASGQDVMVIEIDDNGTRKYETMPAPERGDMPERWLNRGNLYPPRIDAPHNSTAAGIGSEAAGLTSVAVGFRARTDEFGSVVIGHKAYAERLRSVVIGDTATSEDNTSSDIVVIGNAAQAATENVVIGSGSTSDSINNVLIGYNIDSTTINNTVVGHGASAAGAVSTVVGSAASATHASGFGTSVGYSADTGFDSVAVGYNASGGNGRQDCVAVGADSSSTQNDCTALGHNATCDVQGSVAIGADSNTDRASQVEMGVRDVDARRYYADNGTAVVGGDWAASAGWGATPTISAQTGYDAAGSVEVTAAGGTYGANPTLILTFTDGAWGAAPLCVTTRSGGLQPTIQFDVTTITTTAMTLTWNGTPAAGVHNVNYICMGN